MSFSSENSSQKRELVVGLTGASGAMIGQRLIRHLLDGGHRVHAIVSPSARLVFAAELDIQLGAGHEQLVRDLKAHYGDHPGLQVAAADDFAARVSSGSAKIDGMVIAPCSMSTAGAVAHGITLNLIHRAASVSLKERRPLVLVPRESPLSLVHLRSLQLLAEAGAHIVPATTAFYHRPRTVEAMVDFTVGRVLDLLKIEHGLFPRWRESPAEE
ncbi:MAG: Flavin prenyltransferase UbiX [Candidatus Omnitrophica bacterium]|nr:Flavin prenyltransferase UbiX [Candidatus Omnitrophota bacterium]